MTSRKRRLLLWLPLLTAAAAVLLYLTRWQWYAAYLHFFRGNTIAEHHLVLPAAQTVYGLSVPRRSVLFYQNDLPLADTAAVLSLDTPDGFAITKIRFYGGTVWGEWRDVAVIARHGDGLKVHPTRFLVRTPHYLCSATELSEWNALIYTARTDTVGDWLPQHYAFSGCTAAQYVVFTAQGKTYRLNDSLLQQLNGGGWIAVPSFNPQQAMRIEQVRLDAAWRMETLEGVIRLPLQLGGCRYGEDWFHAVSVHPAAEGLFEWRFNGPQLPPECATQLLPHPFVSD